VPLDAAVAGRKVTVAFSPADFPLRNCDLFSMSWHNPTALGCQLLLPVAASLPSGRVAPPRLDWLAAAVGVETSGLPRPSLRASPGARHPMLSTAIDMSRKTLRRRPHLYDGVLRRPGIATGRLHQDSDQGVPPHPLSASPSLSTAPAGNTPVSRKRQSAMSHVRATATIPIRLKRLPPLPQRARNHTLRALSGCNRRQLPANSVVIQRTCRVPALLIPCSRALSPLGYGVGVQPARPPTARRFLHARPTTTRCSQAL
jgi:hypothetical protein